MPRAGRSALDHGRRFAGLRRSGVSPAACTWPCTAACAPPSWSTRCWRARRERKLQRAYARELRAGIREFTWFIVRFTTPAFAWLFANPRNVHAASRKPWSRCSPATCSMRARTLRRLRVFKSCTTSFTVHVARHAAGFGAKLRGLEGRMNTQSGVALSRLSAVAPRIEYLPLEPGQAAACRMRCSPWSLASAMRPCRRVARGCASKRWRAPASRRSGTPMAPCTAVSRGRSVSPPTITISPRPSKWMSASMAGSRRPPNTRIRPSPASSKPRATAHLQRIWNYLDDINTGARRCGALSRVLLGPQRGSEVAAPGTISGRHGHRPARRLALAPGVLAGRPRARHRVREPAPARRVSLPARSTARRRRRFRAPCWWRRTC